MNNLICPSGPEFKGLVNLFGELDAYNIWMLNNNDTPNTYGEALAIYNTIRYKKTNLTVEEAKIANKIWESTHKGNFYVYNASDRDRLLNKLPQFFGSEIGAIKGTGQNSKRWTISLRKPLVEAPKISYNESIANMQSDTKGDGLVFDRLRKMLEEQKAKDKSIKDEKELEELVARDIEEALQAPWHLFSPEIDDIKPEVLELFESNPELANIGTQKQYSQYLDAIFKSNKIFYRGDNSNIETFNYSTGNNKFGNGIYLTTTLDYIEEFIKQSKGEKYTVLVDTSNTVIFKDKISFLEEVARYNNIETVPSNEEINNYTKNLQKEGKTLYIQNSGVADELILENNTQYHILGSKQDIEKFKKYVDNQDDILLYPSINESNEDSVEDNYNKSQEKPELPTIEDIEGYKDIQNIEAIERPELPELSDVAPEMFDGGFSIMPTFAELPTMEEAYDSETSVETIKKDLPDYSQGEVINILDPSTLVIKGLEGKSQIQFDAVQFLALIWLRNPKIPLNVYKEKMLTKDKYTNDPIWRIIFSDEKENGKSNWDIAKKLVTAYAKPIMDYAGDSIDELDLDAVDDDTVDPRADSDNKADQTFGNNDSLTVDHNIKLGKEAKKLLFYIKDVATDPTTLKPIKDDKGNYVPVLSTIGEPKFLALSDVLTYLQGQLSNLPADYKVLKTTMEGLIQYKPWVANVIASLEDVIDVEGKIVEDKSQARAQFTRWATKHYVDLHMGVVEEKEFITKKGEKITVYNAKDMSVDQNSIVKTIQNSWNTALRKNTNIITISNGKEIVNIEELERISNLYKSIESFIIDNTTGLEPILSDKNTAILLERLKIFLEELGIEVEDKTLRIFANSAKSGALKSYTSAGGMVLSLEEHVIDKNGIFKKIAMGIDKLRAASISENEESVEVPLSSGSNPLWDNNGVRDFIKFLARFDNAAFTNSYKNSVNDTIWAFSNNKEHVNRLRELLTNPMSKESLAYRLINTTAFNKPSYYLNRLVTEPEFANYLALEYADAIKINGKTKELSKCSPRELELYKLISFCNKGNSWVQNGKEYRLGHLFDSTMSDKEILMRLKTLLHNTSVEVIKTTDENNAPSKPTLVLSQESVDAIKTIIEAEARRIHHYESLTEEEKAKIDVVEYSKGARYFYNFKYLNKDVKSSSVADNLKKLIYNADGTIKSWDTISDDPLIQEALNTYIQHVVSTQVNKTIETWKKEGIYEDGVLKFVDSSYMKNIAKQAKFEGDYRLQVEFLAYDYLVNNMLHIANNQHLYSGDPAFYYKGTKSPDVIDSINSTLVNLGKRLASENAPGYESNTEITDLHPIMNVVIAQDRVVNSIAVNYIDSLFEGKSGYYGIKATDAQELVTLQEHAFRMWSQGYINKKTYQDILDNYYDLSDDLIAVILGQPMKPVYRGYLYDELIKSEKIIYIKTSSYPMIPQLTKGTPLDKIRSQMEEKEGKLLSFNEARHSLVFNTGIKVGAKVDSTGKSLQLWGEDGKIIENLNFAPYTLNLDRKSWRIQQEVPYNPDKKEVNRSTQVDQNLFVDQLDVEGFKLPDWAGSLTVNGAEVKKVYNDLQKEIYLLAYNELISEITENGSLNRKKLAKLIENEALARNYQPSVLEYLSVEQGKDALNKFKYNLAFIPESDKIESLLLSIIDNKIRKKKMPGFSGVLASETGYEGISKDIVYTGSKTYNASMGLKPQRIIFTDSKGNIVDIEDKGYLELLEQHKSNTLKGYTASIAGSQALLPWKFRSGTGKIIDIKQYIIEKEGVKYLDTSRMDEELLDVFGFRIPNQGPNSKSMIEVVGFLPKYMGDLVITTQDFTVQMGSDFDVDKLYAYIYGTVEVDGKIQRLTEKIPYEKVSDSMSEFDYKNRILQNKNLDIHFTMMSNTTIKVQQDILNPLGFGDLPTLVKEINALKALAGDEDLMIFPSYQSKKYLLARGGKAGCLGYGTKVLMYDGSFKEAQNINIGDKLMGVDSTPRTVLDLCRGVEQMYNIKQTRGITYRVNESHILSLVYKKYTEYSSYTVDKKRYRDFNKILKQSTEEINNITVKDYLSKNIKYKNSTYGYKSSGIEFNKKQIHLDPYYVGLWLGDGATRDITTIHNLDTEVKTYLNNTYGIKFSRGLNDLTHSIDSKKELNIGFKKDFNVTRKGLLPNSKFIPDCYLYNTTDVRLNLLAGLIDSDGHYCKRNKQYRITTKYKNLADQIIFLTRSLGFYSSISFHEGNIKLYPNGKEYTSKGWYNITFIPEKEIPVKISRKKQLIKSTFKNRLHTGITVEKDIVDNYYGFVLDGDHLFMLEDLTVTHNTGYFSVTNTANANMQGKEIDILEFDAETFTRVPLRTNITVDIKSLKKDLSYPYSATGASKHLIHAAYQSASVDEEKEQILSQLNINSGTFSLIWGLIQQGYDEKDIIYIINQDIFISYVNKVANAADNTTKIGIKQAQEKAIKELTTEYEQMLSVEELNAFYISLTDDSKIVSIDALKKAIQKTKVESFTDENGNTQYKVVKLLSQQDYAKIQLFILDRALKAIDLGDKLSSMFSAINTHSKGLGINLFVSTAREAKIEEIRLNPNYVNFSALIGDSVSGYAIKYALLTANNLYSSSAAKDLFYYNNHVFSNIFKTLQLLQGNNDKEVGIGVTADNQRKLWKEFKSYLFSSVAHTIKQLDDTIESKYQIRKTFDIDYERKRLFSNENGNITLADRVAHLQTFEKGKNNYFVNKLEIHRSTEYVNYEYVSFNAAKGMKPDESNIYQGFIDLFNDSSTFSLGVDLVLASYISGGIQEAMQYVKFIPAGAIKKSNFLTALSSINLDDLAKFNIDENIQTFGITSGLYPAFIYQYFQHNSNNLKTIYKKGIIDPKTIEYIEIGGQKIPQYFSLNEDSIKDFSVYIEVGESSILSMLPVIKVKIGSNKERLYAFNVQTQKYGLIDSLGAFGLKEYNSKTTIGNTMLAPVGNKSGIGTDIVEAKEPLQLPASEDKVIIKNKDFIPVIKVGNMTHTEAKNILTTKTDNEVLDIFAEHLANAALPKDLTITTTVGRGTNSYSEPNGKPHVNVLLDVNNPTNTKKRLSHELYHSIVVPILKQYLLDPSKLTPNQLKAIKSLVNLKKEIINALKEYKLTGKVSSIIDESIFKTYNIDELMEFEKMFEDFKKNHASPSYIMPENFNSLRDKYYGLITIQQGSKADITEFINAFMDSIDFQIFTNSITTENKTVYNKIVDALFNLVRNVLGFKINEGSIFEQALKDIFALTTVEKGIATEAKEDTLNLNKNDIELLYPSGQQANWGMLIGLKEDLKRKLYAKQNKAREIFLQTGDNTELLSVKAEIESLNADIEVLINNKNIMTYVSSIKADIDNAISKITYLLNNKYDLALEDILYIQEVFNNYPATEKDLVNQLFSDIDLGKTGMGTSLAYDIYSESIGRLYSQTQTYNDLKIKLIEEYMVKGISANLVNGVLNLPPNTPVTVENIMALYQIPFNYWEARAKDISTFNAYTRDISSINNPLIQLIYTRATEANNATVLEVQDFDKKLEEIENNLLDSLEYERYLKTYKIKYGKNLPANEFTPFLQRSSIGNFTGSLIDSLSDSFYEARKAARPSNFNNASEVARWESWKRNNLLLFDNRILFQNEYLQEQPSGRTYTQSEIDAHLDNMREHLQNDFQYYYDKAIDKMQQYLDDKESYRNSLIVANKTAAEIAVLMEIWIAKNSPFVANDRFYDNYGNIVISGVNYKYTKWSYVVNIPRRTFVTGAETGYYDEVFETLMAIPEAKEYYDFVKETIKHYLEIYPEAFTGGLQSNFLPMYEKTNVLGSLIVAKKYKEIYSKYLSPKSLLKSTGVIVDTAKISEFYKTDAKQEVLLQPKTSGINTVTNQDLNIADALKLFAYGAISYKNKVEITKELDLVSLFVKNLKTYTEPDLKANRLANYKKDSVQPLNVINAFENFKKAYNKVDKVDKALITYKDTTMTDRSFIKGATKWMYLTMLGWNFTAGAVQFISGMHYNITFAGGGQVIDITDLANGYKYMGSSFAKGLYDIIQPLQRVTDTILDKVGIDVNDTIAYKIRAILENQDILEDIAETLVDDEGNRKFDRSSPTFKQDVLAWWNNTIGPTAIYKRSDYINQGALTMAVLLKNKISVTDVNGNSIEISLFDLFDSSGRINITNNTLFVGEDSYTIDDSEKDNIFKAINKGVNVSKELIKSIHGNYRNTRSPIKATSSWTSILLMLRRWLPENLANAWGEERVNSVLEITTEGRYRSSLNLLYNSLADKTKFRADMLKPHKRANLKRVGTEIISGSVMVALMILLAKRMSDGDEPDKDDFIANMLINISERYLNEISFFANPVAATAMVENTFPAVSFVSNLLSIGYNTIVFDEKRKMVIDGKRVKVNRGEYLWENGKRKLIPGFAGYYKLKRNLEQIDKLNR